MLKYARRTGAFAQRTLRGQGKHKPQQGKGALAANKPIYQRVREPRWGHQSTARQLREGQQFLQPEQPHTGRGAPSSSREGKKRVKAVTSPAS